MPVSAISPITIIPPKTSAGSLKNAANQIRFDGNNRPDADLWGATASAFTSTQSQLDSIVSAISQGIIQLPDPIQITDPNGNLIVTFGHIVDPSNNQYYPGIWASDAYFGGSGPASSQIQITPNSIAMQNVSIVDTGSASTITLNPTIGEITLVSSSSTGVTIELLPQTGPDGNPAGVTVFNNTGSPPYQSWIGDRTIALYQNNANGSIVVTAALFANIAGHYCNGIVLTNASGNISLRFKETGTGSGFTLFDQSTGNPLVHLPANTSDIAYMVEPLIVGSATVNLGFPFQVHTGANENFGIYGPVSLGSGIVISSVNDAGNTNEPIELRASAFVFSVGNAGFGSNTNPLYAVDATGYVNASSGYRTNGTAGTPSATYYVATSSGGSPTHAMTVAGGIITS